MPSEWSPPELALLKELVEQGLNDAQIFERFQSGGISRTYKGIQIKRQRKGWRARMKPSPFNLDKAALLEADRALLLFDIHAPLHHAIWIERVIDLALKWKVTGVGVGGDIVDFSSVSYWGRTIGIELDDEEEAATNVVMVLEKNFKHKVLCGGNHEMRVVRKLEHAKKLGSVLDGFCGDPTTVTTDRKWFWLESGGQKFRVAHPKNYNRIPARTAQALASKYRCNVIGGHNHLWGQTRDVSNGWWAIDAGCCLDAKRVGYLEEEMSTNPQAVLGAVIVMEGIPVLLGQDNIEFYERCAVP